MDMMLRDINKAFIKYTIVIAIVSVISTVKAATTTHAATVSMM